MKIKPHLYLVDLLKRFPKGFAVSPTGRVYEIVSQAKNIRDLPVDFGNELGYLVGRNPLREDGDDKFFDYGDDEAISVEEFYKHYGRSFPSIELAEQTKEFLDEIGVGFNGKKEIEIKETEEGKFRLMLL